MGIAGMVACLLHGWEETLVGGGVEAEATTDLHPSVVRVRDPVEKAQLEGPFGASQLSVVLCGS